MPDDLKTDWKVELRMNLKITKLMAGQIQRNVAVDDVII